MTTDPGEAIELKNVTTNNLKAIEARFPLNRFTVVTGVSGSGKSSLVFDTLYGESYRRYVESLSSFARQYLKALPKPGVEDVVNLPPAIAVKQSRSQASNRSTVGTMTELNDILRILFAHLCEIVCPGCGQRVVKDTGETIAADALARLAGKKALVLAPLAHWGKMKVTDLKAQLEAQGFSRAFVAGELKRVGELTAKDVKAADIVIDRVTALPDQQRRLADSAALALKAGRGEAALFVEGEGRRSYLAALKCATCQIEYREPSLALFNFNHPYGACEECQGFGRVSALDHDKVIPDVTASLASQGVAPWNFGQHASMYKWAVKSASRRGLDAKKPFADYTKEEWAWLYQGDDASFEGIDGYFTWLDSKKYKAHYRIHAARFRHYVTCPACRGERLNRYALACRVDGENIAEVARKSIKDLAVWLERLEAADFDQDPAARQRAEALGETYGVSEAFAEGRARLGYLLKIGVGYLSIDRSARTLSGGEQQRINMARSLGSAITGTLFCLDEPSSGLHARDSRNLLDVIYELREQGNTVVVVEHESTVIGGADHLIEIGPEAGHKGGHLVYEGTPQTRLERTAPPWPANRPPTDRSKFLELKGASTHNLKGIDVRIPVGHLVGVCGVSGSGKTSLIQHTLYPLLAKALGQPLDELSTEPVAKAIGPLKLIRQLERVMLVGQEGIGRSTRSNIATYLGLFNEIRKVLSETPLAEARGLKPGSFSFNVPGGRCETCKGLGTIVEDLSFLGEMDVICPACSGKRFAEPVLEVQYKGKNLLDILALTVTEAREFFFDRPALSRVLDAVIGMGLGYVTLGQNTSSFSGGEAQRLKLLSLLKDSKTAKSSVFIFDEPTTGLSDWDVYQLLLQLRSLADQGHTIIMVEHHLAALKACDWLIEIGPEAAEAGGELVFEGEPRAMSQSSRSVTAPFLH